MREIDKDSLRENEVLDKAMVVELEMKELGEISELDSTKLGDHLDVWHMEGRY